MSIKMRLPVNCGGFGFAGTELKVTTTKKGSFVDVPEDGVADALNHGLVDAAAEAAQLEADAAAAEKVAADAVAAAADAIKKAAE